MPPKRAKTTSLRDLLAPYRSEESRGQLAGVVDSPEAIRFLSAWGNTRLEWSTEGKQPKDLAQRWRWIWEGVSLDSEELAVRAQMSRGATENMVRVCAGAGLIYPDGSLSKHAQMLCDEHVKARMPGKARGRPKGARDRKPRKRRGSDDE